MPDKSDAAIRELARRILARPEYAHATSDGAVAPLVRKIFQWLGHLAILRVEAPVLYWAIILGLFAALLGMVTHLVWTLRAAMRAPEPQTQQAAVSRTIRDLPAEADTLAVSGRYLEAAHRLMIASFYALAERSVIELRPDRSNRWIRAALRGSNLPQSLALELDALVERTELRWFGERENDPEIYAQWRSAFDQLSSATR